MTQQNCNRRCVPCKDDAKSHVMSLLDHIVALDLLFLPFFDDLLHLKKKKGFDTEIQSLRSYFQFLAFRIWSVAFG